MAALTGLNHHPGSNLCVEVGQVAKLAQRQDVALDVFAPGLDDAFLLPVMRRTRVNSEAVTAEGCGCLQRHDVLRPGERLEGHLAAGLGCHRRAHEVQPASAQDSEALRLGCHLRLRGLRPQRLAQAHSGNQGHRALQLPVHPARQVRLTAQLPRAQQDGARVRNQGPSDATFLRHPGDVA